MIKINIKILLAIIFLFFASCKEKVKSLKDNRTSIDTTSIVKVDTKALPNKIQIEGECNQDEWIKRYINDLDVILIEYNENKIATENFGNLLLENQNFYLGYIGVNKKRLDIFFNTIEINKSNILKYPLKGYTIVNKNKRFFRGFIEIGDVYRFEHFSDGADDIMKGKIKDQGIFVANYYLEEDSNLSATGVFKGRCVIKWYVDKKNVLRYDDIEDYSDSYSNNQFIGTWTSYKTNKSQICAWGQLRIPCAGDLDIGAAEFSPNEKYFKFGWKGYKP